MIIHIFKESLILPGEADLLERVNVEHYSDSYRSLAPIHSLGVRRHLGPHPG